MFSMGRILGSFLVVSLLAGVAWAEPSEADKKRARALMSEGDDLASKRDYNHALEKYQAADALMNVPTTAIEVARTLAALGKLVEARDVALKVTRMPVAPKEPEVFTKARQEAQTLADQLATRIPSVEISVKGATPGARIDIRIDGKAIPAAAAMLPQKLDPGRHEVVAATPGQPQVTKVITLAEGAREKVELELGPGLPGTEKETSVSTPQPTPPDTTVTTKKTSPLVYIGFGVGAAGLVVGGVTGYLSMSKTSSTKDECSNNKCPSSTRDDIDSAKTLAMVSNIGFGVAIVGAGVGVVGLLTSKKTREQPAATRVSPVIGARFVGVTGSFR
jgi:hypothetical protein